MRRPEKSRLVTREALQAKQAQRLRELLREVYPANPFYRRKFDEVAFDPGELDRSDGEQDALSLLSRLPLTTKAEFQKDQAANPPYGTNLTYERARYTRLHQTSGTTGTPVRWLDTPDSWQWYVDCWKEVYHGLGVRPDDRIFFPFAFGPFIGFWGGFEAASQLGNFCLAGGGLTTIARLRFLLEHRITVVCSTPTYALHLAEVAAADGLDLPASDVRALVVAGEPGGSIPATRERIEAAWGARVYDHCGMTETGSFGFECHENPGGIHTLESEFIVEVLVPGEESPVAPGERGELVLTNLGRAGSPVIRYRTGDLVLWRDEPCPCGRPYGRLVEGILSRVDDMVFVRGNNVYPAAVEAIIRRFTEVAEYRVRVLESGGMVGLRLELDPAPGLDETARSGLAGRVSRAVRNALHFRPEVVVVSAGSLPRFEMKAQRFVRD
ncbi:MAG: AMP-binding protein [Planctomycetota bacterium]|nr:AMP-binding protein [Planctomycetota bacterium]